MVPDFRLSHITDECARPAEGPRPMSEHPPPQEARWPEDVIFTLGHSTLPIAAFLALLHAYGIERLGDIRRIPRSRHNPQFNDTALASSLKAPHQLSAHGERAGPAGCDHRARRPRNGALVNSTFWPTRWAFGATSPR